MNVSQLLTYGVTLISLLVGGLGMLQSKRKDGLIDTAGKEITIKDSYIKTLEAEKARLTSERDSHKTRAEDYKELAQGSPQLKILSKQTGEQTKAIRELTRVLKRHVS